MKRLLDRIEADAIRLGHWELRWLQVLRFRLQMRRLKKELPW